MHYFEKKNKNFFQRFSAGEKEAVKRKKKELPEGIRTNLYQLQEGGVEVLLQKRSREKDAYPGCYDISSAGHIHTGDDYLESALRELEEELGIVAMPEDLRLIGFHEGKIEDFFWGEAFKDHEISAVYLYEKPINSEELTLQKEEVDYVKYMSVDEFVEYFCKAMEK